MRTPELADSAGAVSIGALELFVEVLSQSDTSATAGDDFYDRLLGAVCRLGRMRRSLIFRYDQATRRVRAAGGHGIDLGLFTGAFVTVESAPIAAQALRSARSSRLRATSVGSFPPSCRARLRADAACLCADARRRPGRGGDLRRSTPIFEPPLDAAERHLLWTLGKAAAFASVARFVATEAESSRQLQQRIDLARDIHERVIQRLFGVSMALDGEGDLPADARARCAFETQAALHDLREALQRPLGPRAAGDRDDALQRGGAARRGPIPDLGVSLEEGSVSDVPAALEPLAQSVLREAVRNAQKHARPSWVGSGRAASMARSSLRSSTTVSSDRPARWDGAPPGGFEALQAAGWSSSEPGPGTWQIRLVVPYADG